jgi:Flp pilus assembly protein TadD
MHSPAKRYCNDYCLFLAACRLQKAHAGVHAAAAVLHRALQVIPDNAHMWCSLADMEREIGNTVGARYVRVF